MAQDDRNNEGVDVKTSLFGLKISGPNSLLMVIFFAVVAETGLALWQHYQRMNEHRQMTCFIKLDIYVHTQVKEGIIDWNKVPADLYECIPRFFYERQR